jgi:hypothetical protein
MSSKTSPLSINKRGEKHRRKTMTIDPVERDLIMEDYRSGREMLADHAREVLNDLLWTKEITLDDIGKDPMAMDDEEAIAAVEEYYEAFYRID